MATVSTTCHRTRLTTAEGGGAQRSALSRQNGQCETDGVEPCSEDEESSKGVVAFGATQRDPCAVQISMLGPEPLCPAAYALETVGAVAVNTATSSASHTDQRRYGRDSITGRFMGTGSKIRKSNHILCWLWSICMAPPGGVVDTGTFSSTLLSAPLASLKTRVNGTVVSFMSGAFRSISITW